MIGELSARVQKVLTAAALAAILACAQINNAAAEDPAWTIVLGPADFVIGQALTQLQTRHAWVADFDEQTGNFEVAVRKKAVPIPAPQCRMDYLILKIPFYYPETPKQASVNERRTVYETLKALQKDGHGSVSVRVEAPLGLARTGAHGTELAACNLLFAFPLSVRGSAR